ncbi:hypothetical protein Tco_0446485 [Tanacetum coccineum]
METSELGMSRAAWGQAMDLAILLMRGVNFLRTTVHAQMSEITELQSADHRRQRAISDLLETNARRLGEIKKNNKQRDIPLQGLRTPQQAQGKGDSLQCQLIHYRAVYCITGTAVTPGFCKAGSCRGASSSS